VVRLNKIYTRTGDGGDTGLVDGSRISKADPLMAAIGDIDEANSALGVALLHIEDAQHREVLLRVQNEMFDLGADVATADGIEGALRIVAGQVDRLEHEIDAMNAWLEPLRSFILPGGGEASAHLHLARAVVRRAERALVTAGQSVAINPLALTYVNRLSDHLFVLARLVARAAGGDLLWQPGSTRGP
jgi:cob(I)alamin adenosyltransferase